MTPVIPLREFEQLLAENGCYGKRLGNNDWGAYRTADDVYVCTYAVRHPKSEVKVSYRSTFLRRLKEMQAEDDAASQEGTEDEIATDDYKDSDWYKEQEKYRQSLEEEFRKEEKIPDDD